jgi:hypothetical protein
MYNEVKQLNNGHVSYARLQPASLIGMMHLIRRPPGCCRHGQDSDFLPGAALEYFNKDSCDFKLGRLVSGWLQSQKELKNLEKMAQKPVARRQQGQQDLMLDISSDKEVFVFAFALSHLGVVQ